MGSGIYSIYKALQPRFRQDRWKLFLELFHPQEKTTILDIGGNVYDWTPIPIASQIRILNVAPTDSSPEYLERFSYTMGDGRCLPFADQSFDIVYSNSVIEHLHNLEDQHRFARECLRVGRSVFVQTPNRWFPIEVHFLAPFFHYLPKRAQSLFLPHLSFRGLVRSGDDMELQSLFRELRLLGRRDMKTLFPGCRIHAERLGGVTKSLIAVRVAPAPGEAN